MKVQLKAFEIVDAEIGAVSLVKNAAMRAPFQIIKTEDITEAPIATEGVVMNTMRKFMGDDPDAPQISFVAVRKSAEEAVLAGLEGSELKFTDREDQGEVVLFKQDSYVEDELGSTFVVNDDVAIGLNQVCKSFNSMLYSEDFADNISSAQFYPSLSNALGVFDMTVWACMEEAVNKDEASANVAKAVKDFGNYVKKLVTSVPEELIKADLSLQKKIGGGNVSGEHVTKASEEDTVSKNGEVVNGDLDGLELETEVQKAEVETVERTIKARGEDGEVIEYLAKYEVTDGVEIEVSRELVTAETEETEESETVEKSDESEETTVETAETAETETVEKEEADEPNPLLDAINSLTETVTKAQEDNDKRFSALEDKLEKTEQVAKTADEKAGKTVVHVAADIDEGFGTINRERVKKSEQAASGDIWGGLMTDFD